MTMSQQAYHVHSVEQDLAGKWYARVCLTADEAVFLKFDAYPAMVQIQESAGRSVEARRLAEQKPVDLGVVAPGLSQSETGGGGSAPRVSMRRGGV